MAFEALAGGGDGFFGSTGLWWVREMAQLLALELFSAGAAHGDEGVAAAIEQDHGLLAAVEGGLSFADQEAGEELFLAGLLEFDAHVDEFDGGQGAVDDALGHGDALVLAGLGILPALERGRGGAEDDGSSGQLGAHDGDVAGVVARGFFLLVALVVFFVDEDEAEVGDGGEDGGAGADDDGGFAAADAVPLLGALGGGEGGVEQGDAGRRRWRRAGLRRRG